MNVEDNEDVQEIELASAVRESAEQIIHIENPTDQEVKIDKTDFTYNTEYHIEITPDTLVIPAKAERGFEIHYRPLTISENETDLVLKNATLGEFKYKLLLKGLPPTSQRSMAFKCALGQDVVQAFKFTHYLKKPTNYAIKFERLDQNSSQMDFKADVA